MDICQGKRVIVIIGCLQVSKNKRCFTKSLAKLLLPKFCVDLWFTRWYATYKSLLKIAWYLYHHVAEQECWPRSNSNYQCPCSCWTKIANCEKKQKQKVLKTIFSPKNNRIYINNLSRGWRHEGKHFYFLSEGGLVFFYF